VAQMPWWQSLSGLGLVAVGSWHQHVCHGILRALRATGSYGLPRGDWFALRVAAPHYLAELVIYAGLLVLTPCVDAALLLGFSTVTLCITARQTLAWYDARFPGAFKWAVFPGLY